MGWSLFGDSLIKLSPKAENTRIFTGGRCVVLVPMLSGAQPFPLQCFATWHKMMSHMRMVEGKVWKKCCPITCGSSAGAATQGMTSTRYPCTRDASACLQSGRPGDIRYGCSAGLEGKTFNDEEGKSSPGQSLPSRAFSNCPWRSATATTDASGMAKSSRREEGGCWVGDNCWCWHGPAAWPSPNGFCKQQDMSGAFDLGFSLESITTFMKEVGVKYSLLTTLIYTAQTGSKSRLYSYSFLFFPRFGNGENLLSLEGKCFYFCYNSRTLYRCLSLI